MNTTRKHKTETKLLRNSLITTVIAGLGCLSTHILVAFGVIALTAKTSLVEHSLLIGTVLFAALTVYAFIKHRNSGCDNS